MTSAFRRAQLAQGLGFDLANAFARDVELLADLFERMFALAADAEAEADDLLLLGVGSGYFAVIHTVGRLRERALDRLRAFLRVSSRNRKLPCHAC